MRLVFVDAHNAWGIIHGAQPVAIGGTTYFAERETAVSEIAKRGLVVLDDGQIVRPEAAPSPPSDPVVDEMVAEFAPSDEETSEDVVDEIENLTIARTADDSQAVEATRTTPIRQDDEAPRPKGRPRQFTPEEIKERRREQNRRYYHRTKEARKSETAQRAKDWWESHPDKVREYRERANAKRRERYANDPDFRARVAAANKAYQERRRTEGGAG